MKNTEYINAMKDVKPSQEAIDKLLDIANEEPEKIIEITNAKKSKNRKYFERAISIAACFILLTGIFFARDTITSFFDNKTSPDSATNQAAASTNAEYALNDVTFFKDRKEFIKYLKAQQSRDWNTNEGINLEVKGDAFATTSQSVQAAPSLLPGDSYTQYSNSSPDSTDSASTYLQELGVDEADFIKTKGKYIYYLCNEYNEQSCKHIGKVLIFKTDKDKYEKVSELTINEDDRAGVRDMYVTDNRLIVIKQRFSDRQIYGCFSYKAQDLIDDVKIVDAEIDIDTASTTLPPDANTFEVKETTEAATTDAETSTTFYNPVIKDNGFPAKVSAVIYDITNPEKPVALEEFGQSGNYISSRIVNGHLYLITSHYSNIFNSDSTDEDLLPAIYTGNTSQLMPYTDIAYAKCFDGTAYSVISGVDIKECKRLGEAKALLGAGYDIYCSSNNVYIYGSVYDYDDEHDKTSIIKISIEGGEPEFKSTSTVSGYVDSSYSLSEKDGNLLVYTTDYIKSHSFNSLYVLDENLNIITQTEKFAKDEYIKAVKYIGDYAYVITYEETDPLFVFDLSDISNPKRLGEVKITGFSTMLVDIGDNMLLGIGYGTHDEDYTDLEVTGGIKLALFDVSDALNPKVLDSKVYDSYYSTVQDQPKTFVQNTAKGLYTFAYTTEDDDYGALVFSVENGKIVEKTNFLKEHDIGQYVISDRVTYVDDYFYLLADFDTFVTLSPFTIK